MAWCFSTRASVATVLTTHPCISQCLRVNCRDLNIAVPLMVIKVTFCIALIPQCQWRNCEEYVCNWPIKKTQHLHSVHQFSDILWPFNTLICLHIQSNCVLCASMWRFMKIETNGILFLWWYLQAETDWLYELLCDWLTGHWQTTLTSWS